MGKRSKVLSWFFSLQTAAQEEANPVNDESLLEEDELALAGVSPGKCGDYVYYTLSDDGVLTISGSGDMWDWQWRNLAPWRADKEDIVKIVVIESGVTRIGNYAFYGCKSLTIVMIGASVTSIGYYAFDTCENLREVKFTGNAPSFELDPEDFTYGTFENDTLIAYYPCQKSGWTKYVLQDYGGTITWVPVGSNGSF